MHHHMVGLGGRVGKFDGNIPPGRPVRSWAMHQVGLGGRIGKFGGNISPGRAVGS